MADGELLDAREAMSLLGINENELQTLVARGDLRAFRSAGTMKFRRDDVVTMKTEKQTEPTIIIPASGGGRKGGSGILPTVGGQPRIGSGRAPAPQHTPAPAHDQTGDLVLDDIELSPPDDAGNTAQVTVQGDAIKVDSGIGGRTVVETLDTADGHRTVVENIQTGTAEPISGITSIEQPVRRSGRIPAAGSGPAIAAPQVSRVAPGIAPTRSPMQSSRRSVAAYQAKSSSPFVTALLILNTLVLMIAGSIVGVWVARGGSTYDVREKQRIIPPFLSEQGILPAYKWYYKATPGVLHDDAVIPSSEYHPSKSKGNND